MKKLLTLSLVVALLLVSSVGALAGMTEDFGGNGTATITIRPTIDVNYPGTVDLKLEMDDKEVVFEFEKNTIEGTDHYELKSVGDPVHFTLTNNSIPGEGSKYEGYKGALNIEVNPYFAGGVTSLNCVDVALKANATLDEAMEPNPTAIDVYVEFIKKVEAVVTVDDIQAAQYITTIEINVTKIVDEAD